MRRALGRLAPLLAGMAPCATFAQQVTDSDMIAPAADYAAFVGLSEVRGKAPPPVPSILDLFAPRDRAGGLTD